MSARDRLTDSDILCMAFLKQWNQVQKHLSEAEGSLNQAALAMVDFHFNQVSCGLQTHKLTQSMNAKQDKVCSCEFCIQIPHD